MSTADYSRSYEVRWADLDPNGHLRHTAYADYGTAVRFQFLADHGFSAARFRELGFGPLLITETSQFFKEVLLGETITITLHVVSRSPDGMRWSIQHDFYKANGQRAACVKVDGAWIDLRARKLTAPPADLLAVMDRLARPADDADPVPVNR